MPHVVVINETLARQAFSATDPIGQVLMLLVGNQQLPHEVVGVAADPRRSVLGGDERPFQYWLSANALQSDLLRPTYLVFRSSDPAARAMVRRELLGLDPRYAIDTSMHPYPVSQTLYYVQGVLAMPPILVFQNPNDKGSKSRLTSATRTATMSHMVIYSPGELIAMADAA
jgi:hypothetical protein